MSLNEIKEKIPGFGRDIRLNLDSVLTVEGAPGLSLEQIGGVALACSYSVQQLELAGAIISDLSISSEVAEAAKAAASIMAMNNVYYRFLHLSQETAEGKEVGKLPARLRMSVIGKPGIPKVDFELMSLAISAIEGCGMCINAHVHEIKKAGIADEGVQSAVRIAAVINAVKTTLAISAP